MFFKQNINRKYYLSFHESDTFQHNYANFMLGISQTHHTIIERVWEIPSKKVA
jgi:hypothetical protein